MANRRNFLIQSTLATCAFTFLKPFGGAAGILSRSSLPQKLTVLHGTGLERLSLQHFNGHILNLDKNDVLKNQTFLNETLLPCRVEKKGEIKIGIIHLADARTSVHLNKTAIFLKTRQNCHLIIGTCDGQPQEDNFSKEIALANSSIYIDLFVCHKQNNMRYNTHVAHNKEGHEVLISAAFGNRTTIGMIDILFNDQLQKTNIAVKSDAVEMV